MNDNFYVAIAAVIVFAIIAILTFGGPDGPAPQPIGAYQYEMDFSEGSWERCPTRTAPCGRPLHVRAFDDLH